MGVCQRVLFRQKNLEKLKNDAASKGHRYNFRSDRTVDNRQSADRKKTKNHISLFINNNV